MASEPLFERCSCGRHLTGVFPDDVDTVAPPGPGRVIVSVCTTCDYVPGFGGPPIHRRNLSLIRNVRWE
jgi:hypothetical protein